MCGAQERILSFDVACLDERDQRIFHAERSAALRECDLLVQMMQRISPNVLARAIADHQQFRNGKTPAFLTR